MVVGAVGKGEDSGVMSSLMLRELFHHREQHEGGAWLCDERTTRQEPWGVREMAGDIPLPLSYPVL